MRKGRTDSMGRRMEPKARRQDVLAAALNLSRVHGYQNITREQIAAASGCSPSLVGSLFGTMIKLRRAIMSAAIAGEDLIVIGQGLAARESKALAAPEELRVRAARHVAGVRG